MTFNRGLQDKRPVKDKECFVSKVAVTVTTHKKRWRGWLPYCTVQIVIPSIQSVQNVIGYSCSRGNGPTVPTNGSHRRPRRCHGVGWRLEEQSKTRQSMTDVCQGDDSFKHKIKVVFLLGFTTDALTNLSKICMFAMGSSTV
mmetsp:Transcript_28329/g.47010  ORF Transcript_28329/g.47010 Transcript_28329/m.47010 type:complete len:142 (-) Transcript_28329:348-773(-)